MKTMTMIVNDALDLGVGQATTLLLARAAAMGHTVHVAGCDGLHVDEAGDVRARAWDVSASPTPEEVLERVSRSAPRELVLQHQDVVWVRTNPGRDDRAWLHQNLLVLLMLVQAAGVRVLNDPMGLQRASSKLYLNTFPERVRPKTLVSHDPVTVREFIERIDSGCVLKPLRGTHGRDVFKVSGPQAENLIQLIELMTRHDAVIAQEFVPDAVHGDVRILLAEGRLFEIDGKACAVRRKPGGRDFRSNVHAGGSVVPAQITDVMRETIEAIEPVLVRDGIFFAGLDFIGDKIVEINVFSPGGLGDAQRFEGPDFASALVERALS